MKVSLLEFTGKGSPNEAWRAVDLLLFTKNTRLTMSPGLMTEIAAWPEDKKLAELGYMANTIPSSWEFVDYVFLIEGVTRAFTHQLVRTRPNSYAQQTMRVLDVSEGRGWDYTTGPTIADSEPLRDVYECAMEHLDDAYKTLIAGGAKIEDARGLLPTNIQTNIVMKTNMRTLVETIQKRSSPRTQGEYREVIDQMKALVTDAHPWIKLFLERTADKAAADLDAEIMTLTDPDQRIRMIKLVDQLRRA
jgi:flavin-dependent thymidylate synthase